MKLKFNLMASAALLALASAPAFAAINAGTTPDLLLIAYDGSGLSPTASYVRDLGAISQIGNNNLTFSAPLSSIFSSTFSGVSPSNIYFTVAAVDGISPKLYSTGTVENDAGLVSADVAGNANGLLGPLGGITQLDVASNGYIRPNGEYTGSANAGDVTNGVRLTNVFSFGFPLSGQGVGSSLNFIKIDTDGTASLFDPNAALTGGGGYFTLLDAQGDVKWTGATVAAVADSGRSVAVLAPACCRCSASLAAASRKP